MKLDEIRDAEIQCAPRKVSLAEPNVANYLARWCRERWPELARYPDAWVTGSHAWRAQYGKPMPDAGSDLDIFVTSREEYDALLGFLRTIETEPDKDRPQPTKSRDTDEDGCRLHTERGWIDLWLSMCSPLVMLQSYPTDGYAHCRAAFNPSTGAVLLIANEAA